MTCTVEGSLAPDGPFETRHPRVKPATLQIAVASFNAPVTIVFETAGVAETTSVTDGGTSPRDRADGGCLAFSRALSTIHLPELQLNIEIKAIQIMIR
jgi:hypothetical protein